MSGVGVFLERRVDLFGGDVVIQLEEFLFHSVGSSQKIFSEQDRLTECDLRKPYRERM